MSRRGETHLLNQLRGFLCDLCESWMILEVSVRDEAEGLNVMEVKTDSKQICPAMMLMCIFYCLFELHLHLENFLVHRISSSVHKPHAGHVRRRSINTSKTCQSHHQFSLRV